jgi:hypothetical protein
MPQPAAERGSRRLAPADGQPAASSLRRFTGQISRRLVPAGPGGMKRFNCGCGVTGLLRRLLVHGLRRGSSAMRPRRSDDSCARPQGERSVFVARRREHLESLPQPRAAFRMQLAAAGGRGRTFCRACSDEQRHPEPFRGTQHAPVAAARACQAAAGLQPPAIRAADGRREHGRPPLRFEFLEDQRSNPQVARIARHDRAPGRDHHHQPAGGRRRRARRRARADVRTLSHAARPFPARERSLLPGRCWPRLGPAKDEFRALFGDEREDYAAALERYHEAGPAPHWGARFVSPYASSHPMEDWAECWSHYLHITDGLETARATRFVAGAAVGETGTRKCRYGSPCRCRLNELARGLGVDDPYPFVLNGPVRAKLAFIHRRLSKQLRRTRRQRREHAERLSRRSPASCGRAPEGNRRPARRSCAGPAACGDRR